MNRWNSRPVIRIGSLLRAGISPSGEAEDRGDNPLVCRRTTGNNRIRDPLLLKLENELLWGEIWLTSRKNRFAKH